jgi:hypothetical protein
VLVYKWQSPGGWAVSQTLTSSATTYDGFGLALALSSLTLVIGSPHALDGTTSSAGNVTLLRRTTESSLFAIEASLRPPAAHSLSAFDSFGFNVATLSDDVVAVTCRNRGGRAAGGFVFLYQRFGSLWTLVQTVLPPAAAAGSFFASSISASGTFASGIVLAVGAPYYQTEYVPWPFLNVSAPGTAELYALISLDEDFSKYTTSSMFTPGKLNSMWSEAGFGVLGLPGDVIGSTCEPLTAPALVFNNTQSNSRLKSIPLYLPTSSFVIHVALRYCGPLPVVPVGVSVEATMSLMPVVANTGAPQYTSALFFRYGTHGSQAVESSATVSRFVVRRPS